MDDFTVGIRKLVQNHLLTSQVVWRSCVRSCLHRLFGCFVRVNFLYSHWDRLFNCHLFLLLGSNIAGIQPLSVLFHSVAIILLCSACIFYSPKLIFCQKCHRVVPLWQHSFNGCLSLRAGRPCFHDQLIQVFQWHWFRVWTGKLRLY